MMEHLGPVGLHTRPLPGGEYHGSKIHVSLLTCSSVGGGAQGVRHIAHEALPLNGETVPGFNQRSEPGASFPQSKKAVAYHHGQDGQLCYTHL